MRHWLLTVALAIIGSVAQAAPVPTTYVHSVRITPGAQPIHVLAFQNTSANIDVLVHKIEVIGASTQAVTGGLMQFWVYASTSLTHSVAAGVTASYGSANASQPSYLSVSTAPVSVLLEGDTGILTTAQRNALSGTALPLIPPLRASSEETATSGLYDSWSAENQDAQNPSGPLVLPKNANRALVMEKRMSAASDFAVGLLQIRVFYTIR